MRPASDAGVCRRDGTSRRSWGAFTFTAFVMWQGRGGLATSFHNTIESKNKTRGTSAAGFVYNSTFPLSS